jgi:hypothetical protein
MVNLVFPLPLLLLPILVAGFPAPQGYSVEKEYPDIEPKYQYQYAVTDDYTKSNFQAQEERDGFSTLGSYRVALPDGRIQIVTYTANEFGYKAEVTYEGEAVYPEDFEAQTGVGGGIYSASPSVHSNTVYKAKRKKAKPSPKKPYNQTPSSIHKPSQYKPAPKRPVLAPSTHSNQPQNGSPFKADRVQPKPVKIPYNQDPPQFNPVHSPSYRPIPSNPNLAHYKLDGAQSNPVARPRVPQKPANPAPYDRVRFEEIVKLEPAAPAAQPYRPEPRQPASLAAEYRIDTEGVLLEEAAPSVDGDQDTEDISKVKSVDKVVKSEEEEKAVFEETTSDEEFQGFDGQQQEEEEEVKLVDDHLGNPQIVVIDEREEVNKEILKPLRSEESIVVEEEPSPEAAEPHNDDIDIEKDVPFEVDVGEVVKAEEETVEESKTEDTLDISKLVVVKAPQTEE